MLEDYDDTDLDEAIANDILDELEDRYDAKHPRLPTKYYGCSDVLTVPFCRFSF